MRKQFILSAIAVISVTAALAVVAGCGDSDSPKATSLAITTSEDGKKPVLTVPSETDGGLTEVTLTNKGKIPHEAQLILVEGDHSVDQVLKIIEADNPKIPDWMRAEGGNSPTPPGKTSKVTINLDEGKYYVVDDVQNGRQPMTADLQVGDGETGDLPSTDATITGAELSEDKYQWQVSGLKSGTNTFLFKSEGDEALHHVITLPLKKDLTDQQLVQALEKEDNAAFDFAKSQGTAVLDGGRDMVTTVDLDSGKSYGLLCFLTDRDGGKPHFQEGMAKVITIQ